MSDGPHRSLPMRKSWKLVAKHASKRAWSMDEVANDLCTAATADFKREVSASLFIALDGILQSTKQTSMFDENGAEAIQQLRNLSVEGSFDERLIGGAEIALRRGQLGDQALQEAVQNALLERGGDGTLQVDEHYKRKAKPAVANRVRDRLQQALRSEKFQSLGKSLVEQHRGKFKPSGKDAGRGLDDGPALNL